MELTLIQKIAIYALPVIFAITVHEAAHGYAARYFGDTTAYLQGALRSTRWHILIHWGLFWCRC